MTALVYAAGVATGVFLMAANRWSIRRAVEQERSRSQDLLKENRQMREDLINFTHASDCRDAYNRGKSDGRNDPVTNAERFARNFEGRRVQFKAGRSA